MYHRVHVVRAWISYPVSQLYTFIRSPIIKDFCIYSGGSLLLRSSSLLVAPVSLSVLSPEEFGVYALANSFIAIGSVVAGLGLRQLLSLEFFHASSAQRREIVNDMIVVYLVISVPLFVALMFFMFFRADIFFASTAPLALIVVSLLSCFLSFFVELFYQILKYQCKAMMLTRVQLSAACVVIVSSLFFLLIVPCGVCGLLLSALLGAVYGACIGARAYVASRCWESFDWHRGVQKMSYYLRHGFPFIPTVLFGWLLASGSRWILAKHGSLHDVGIFSLADSVGQLYTLFILYPMSGSYLPHLLNQYAANPQNLHAVERWNMRVMWVSMIGMALLISSGYGICCACLQYMLPVKYHEALPAVWFILMGNVFLMGSYFASALIQFRKKTSMLLISIGVAALCNLLLTMLLVPSFGVQGCVWASMISYALYFAVILFFNWRLRLCT